MGTLQPPRKLWLFFSPKAGLVFGKALLAEETMDCIAVGVSPRLCSSKAPVLPVGV